MRSGSPAAKARLCSAMIAQSRAVPSVMAWNCARSVLSLMGPRYCSSPSLRPMRRTLFDDTHEEFRAAFRSFLERHAVPNRRAVGRRRDRRPGAVHGRRRQRVPRHGRARRSTAAAASRDFRFNVVIAEELQRADVNAAGLGLTLHNDICLPYFLHLTNDEQKARWLPGICAGELITAVAMTEPGIGSDLASMTTTAIRDGDHYVVNGSKTFITNGINADLVITAVKTDPSQRHRGMSLLVLERGMEGFARGRNLEKVGMHAQDTAELFFDDVRVPVTNRLGDEGAGFFQLVSNLPQERLSIAVTGVAAARAAFDRTLAYAKERQAFGQPIASFQHNRFVLAEMATEIEIARDVRRPLRPRPQRRGADTPTRRRWPSGGARSCRAGSSTAACSSTAATAT